jgi:hypothetical protein
MTVRQLVKRSMQMIGSLGSGVTPTGDEVADGLLTLNAMVEEWATQGLTMYAVTRYTKVLVASQASYTIGASGGNITAPWPFQIEAALLRDTSVTPNLEVPLNILDLQEWQALTQRSTTGTWPTDLYYNASFPLGTIYLYPVGTSTDRTLVLDLPTPVSSFASADTVIALPPGYDKLLRYNLAKELCAEYKRPLDPIIAEIAVKSMTHVKTKNERPRLLRADPALLHAGGRANIYAGTD